MAVVFVNTCGFLGPNCRVCPVSRNTLQILQAVCSFPCAHHMPVYPGSHGGKHLGDEIVGQLAYCRVCSQSVVSMGGLEGCCSTEPMVPHAGTAP